MKNVERQKSLERNYGLKGDYFYCECCEYCKDRNIIRDGLPLKGRNNCKYKKGIMFGVPCARAFNKWNAQAYRRQKKGE